MARTLHIYPKASIEGSTWTLTMKVYEPATGVGRGWTIGSVHQHEGDSTVTEG